MKKILVVLGPTATGKTDLAIKLAKKFNGEIVSCDSRQVYRGLDIGTGKFPGQEVQFEKHDRFWIMDGVKVWSYDLISPEIQYTVFDYVKDATEFIRHIHSQGKLPIIVGGTGLYLKALLEGFSHLSIPIDQSLREHLEKLSLELLQEKLQKLSVKKWEDLNFSEQHNKRRLIRHIEIEMNPYILEVQNSKFKIQSFDVLKIGLAASREVLYQRIDERVIKRLDQGMVEEAVKLNKAGLSLERMRQLGLEYRILADYISKKIINIENLEKILQTKIHQYAKRQLTWFKIQPNIFWFDITDKKYLIAVEKQVEDWYNI